MSEIKTLTKGSQDFQSYLLGTFSRSHRALPIQTLNVNSSLETVTFEIKPVSEIQRPSFLRVFLTMMKPRAFMLVLFPMYLILVKNIADKTVADPWLMLLSTLGILCVFASVSLRNDYIDHMRGMDRINPAAGSRVIQNGWMTAAQVRSWANFFLILGLFAATPVAMVFPSVLGVVLVALPMAVVSQFYEKGSFKYFKGGEIFAFLLLGPLLAIGYQISIAGFWDLECIYIGVLWGWLVVFVQHIKNLEYIMIHSQAGFSNTVCWLGFDKGKTLIKWWWLIFLAMFITYHVRFSGDYWTWFLAGTFAFAGLPFFIRLNHLNSPVGSDMPSVRRRGFGLVMLVIFLWTLENIWYWAQWQSWIL